MFTLAAPPDGNATSIGEESRLHVVPPVIGPAKSTLICEDVVPAVVGSKTTMSFPSLSGCAEVSDTMFWVRVKGTTTKGTGFESGAGEPGF